MSAFRTLIVKLLWENIMPLVVFDGLAIQYSGLRSSIIDQDKDELQMAQVLQHLGRNATAYLLLCMQVVNVSQAEA